MNVLNTKFCVKRLYHGFCFTLIQTTYTSFESPYFKEFNEPRYCRTKHTKVMAICLEGSVTFTQNGNNQLRVLAAL